MVAIETNQGLLVNYLFEAGYRIHPIPTRNTFVNEYRMASDVVTATRSVRVRSALSGSNGHRIKEILSVRFLHGQCSLNLSTRFPALECLWQTTARIAGRITDGQTLNIARDRNQEAGNPPSCPSSMSQPAPSAVRPRILTTVPAGPWPRCRNLCQGRCECSHWRPLR